MEILNVIRLLNIHTFIPYYEWICQTDTGEVILKIITDGNSRITFKLIRGYEKKSPLFENAKKNQKIYLVKKRDFSYN